MEIIIVKVLTKVRHTLSFTYIYKNHLIRITDSNCQFICSKKLFLSTYKAEAKNILIKKPECMLNYGSKTVLS